jgi:hypothetical protein
MESQHLDHLIGRFVDLKGEMWRIVGVDRSRATPSIQLESEADVRTANVSLSDCFNGLVADEAIDLNEPP